jgi:diaminopimelate epimerase
MLTFYKYHGAGNDFILIDNRSSVFDPQDTILVQQLCHRRFGIGADGVILLENSDRYDFSMVYMNSDGSIGSMCGNGGRCIVSFAHYVVGLVKDPRNVIFEACDGLHEAQIYADEVRLKMQDVGEITKRNGHIFLRSGTTPHNVVFVEDINNFPVISEGKKFQTIEEDQKGVNVNFVEEKDGIFNVRTYERGVWDETMACGTGATSVAIACASNGMLNSNICNIKMPGGNLKIEFEKTPEGVYHNIWLRGKAQMIFKGSLE